MSIAIGLGGPLVAALALAFGEIRSRRDQQHALDLARSARWFETRREVTRSCFATCTSHDVT
jgi:hypothetical protein